jgi:hypothetical protein
MLREESTRFATEYINVNIYGLDDHFSVSTAGESWRTRPEHRHMFHGNPWTHVRLDLGSGKLVEIENLYSTPESLYKLAGKDILANHIEDVRSFRLSPQEYISRYFVGHYKPVGNHFFAFAVKDAVAAWLDPKPVAYRKGSETIRP